MDIISIIVPVYNAEKYLTKCIESIISQTYTQLQIILVDDGSSDSSGKICDDFSNKDSRIMVVHQDNKGAVNARKTGLKKAFGRYIAFADADDWLEPNMIEELYKDIIKYNADISMCNRYDETGESKVAVRHGFPEGYYDKERLECEIYPKMIVNDDFFEWGIFPGLWDKLFKRELIIRYHNEVNDNITLGDDALCTYACMLNAKSIYINSKYLYHYIQNPTSMVRRLDENEKEKERSRYQLLFLSGISIFREFNKDYKIEEQWKKYVLFLMVPRADVLYENIEKLSFLFPYPNVKAGDNIIIYGAGLYGQRLFDFLNKTKLCNVVAIVDMKWKELQNIGIPAISPQMIKEHEFDYIVISCSFAKTRQAIFDYLKDIVQVDKIQVMDETIVMSDESMKAFGLIEKRMEEF